MVAGSLIGVLKETQEILDFCEEHKVVLDIEKIKMCDINTAFERIKTTMFAIDLLSTRKVFKS